MTISQPEKVNLQKIKEQPVESWASLGDEEK